MDPIGETLGEGKRWGEPRAEMEGGTGEEAREVGHEVMGERVEVVRVRSGCDTELIQHRLDSLESLRSGRWLFCCCNWSSRSAAKAEEEDGWLREGREVEVAERVLV